MAKDLLSKMLNPHPLSRASVEDILSHPWMQQHRGHQHHRHPAKTTILSQKSVHASQQQQHSQHPVTCHTCGHSCQSSCTATTTTTTTTTTTATTGHRDCSAKHVSLHVDSHSSRPWYKGGERSKSRHYTALRKNSSGCSSGYSSDASGIPSPVSPFDSKSPSPICGFKAH